MSLVCLFGQQDGWLMQEAALVSYLVVTFEK